MALKLGVSILIFYQMLEENNEKDLYKCKTICNRFVPKLFLFVPGG